MNDQERIAEYEAVLRDIAFGADMMLQVASGAFASYVKEVKRVSKAALEGATTSASSEFERGRVAGLNAGLASMERLAKVYAQ